MRRLDRRLLAPLVAVALVAVLLLPASTQAAADFAQSPRTTAIFWICEDNPGGGGCAPLFYAWDAWVRITYDWIDLYTISFYEEHQVINMYNANPNPCGIWIGHKTEVYSGGSHQATVWQDHYVWGWHDTSTLSWGAKSWPGLRVTNPGFEGVLASGTETCLGYNEDRWDIPIP